MILSRTRPLTRLLKPITFIRLLSTPSPSSLPPSPSTSTSTSTTSSQTNTVSSAEIAHFSSLSSHWWNPIGEFSLLHRMNPVRIKFLKESLLRIEEFDDELEVKNRWLEGKEVLDVGCGGGIFAEALSRLGADTLAIDAAPINIVVAQSHASLDPSFPPPFPSNIPSSTPASPSSSSSPSLSSISIPGKTGKNKLQYRHIPAEELIKEGKQFDVVCSMEVIEHVEDPRGFLDCLTQLTKPGGLLILSTISRTPFANLLTITLAEQVLRFITPGTHTYSKFIKPSELQSYFEEGTVWKGSKMERRGCLYDPIKGGWRLLGEGEWAGLGEQCNYFAGIRKPL